MAYILSSKLASRKLFGRQIQKLIFFYGSRAEAGCVQQILQKPNETHDDKNARLGRPLSPHLTIYAPQYTSMLSIMHRITGTVGGVYLMTWATYSVFLPYNFLDTCEYIESLEPPTPLIWAAKYVLSFPYVYHYINGIRHLSWDTGNFLEMKMVLITGITMVCFVTLGVVATVFYL